MRMDPQRFVMLAVRTPGDPAKAASLVRGEMQTIAPDLPITDVMTMDRLMAERRWPVRIIGSLFGLFALIALAVEFKYVVHHAALVSRDQGASYPRLACGRRRL